MTRSDNEQDGWIDDSPLMNEWNFKKKSIADSCCELKPNFSLSSVCLISIVRGLSLKIIPMRLQWKNSTCIADKDYCSFYIIVQGMFTFVVTTGSFAGIKNSITAHALWTRSGRVLLSSVFDPLNIPGHDQPWRMRSWSRQACLSQP